MRPASRLVKMFKKLTVPANVHIETTGFKPKDKENVMKSTLRHLAGFVVLAAVAALPASVALAQSQKVLKFIPQADLRILDPISTTAYITRNHGYMVVLIGSRMRRSACGMNLRTF